MRLICLLVAMSILTGEANTQEVTPPSNLVIVGMGGQSNMEGPRRDVPAENISARHDKRTLLFTLGNKFVPAFDPISTTEPAFGGSAYPDVWPINSRRGHTPAIPFADKWAKLNQGRSKLLLVPFAKSGTRLIEHLPSSSASTIFGASIDRLNRAKRHGKVTAILFSQGEQDAQDCSQAILWAARFERIVSAWRTRYGLKLPIIFTQLGDAPVERANHFPCWGLVKEQQERAAMRIPNSRMIETEGLQKYHDEVHYTPRSMKIIGETMAVLLADIN